MVKRGGVVGWKGIGRISPHSSWLVLPTDLTCFCVADTKTRRTGRLWRKKMENSEHGRRRRDDVSV